jgi:hypothetical protein
MPSENKYRIKEPVELLRLVHERRGWYDYNSLDFQLIEDVYFTGDAQVHKKGLSISNEILKNIFPIFMNAYSKEECSYIFQELINMKINAESKCHYLNLVNKIIECTINLKKIEHLILPNYMQIDFIDLKRIIHSVLRWDLTHQSEILSSLLEKIGLF